MDKNATMYALLEEALEAMFNLAPRFREAQCFNGKNCGYCTACKIKNTLARIIKPEHKEAQHG